MGGFGGFRTVESASTRIGVVDIGSNSVRMVVFDGATRSPAYFFNEKVLCGLGSDLRQTGRLSPGGVTRAMATLHRFARLAQLMQLDVVAAVATAAVRDAEDGPAFRDRIEAETGLRVRIASGADEARLAAQGVVLGAPGAHGLTADLGGASLELTPLVQGHIEPGVTLPVGPLRLNDLAPDDREAAIAAALTGLPAWEAARGADLYCVGGAWRALAKADMARRSYPLRVLHDYTLTPGDAMTVADWAMDAPVEALRKAAKSSDQRLETIPNAARLLARMIEASEPARVVISAYGLREGVLYEHLPAPLRAQDPLVQGAAVMERLYARFPGFGQELADWLAPLFPDVPRRIVTAACLLSDTVWRTHPDYRARACFETATRASLSGISHAERAFLGVSMLWRYKGGRSAIADESAAALLDADSMSRAETLGRAIRLGAMLCGSAPGVLPRCPMGLREGVLSLHLGSTEAPLAGDVVEKRLASLAASLGVEPALTMAL